MCKLFIYKKNNLCSPLKSQTNYFIFLATINSHVDISPITLLNQTLKSVITFRTTGLYHLILFKTADVIILLIVIIMAYELKHYKLYESNWCQKWHTLYQTLLNCTFILTFLLNNELRVSESVVIRTWFSSKTTYSLWEWISMNCCGDEWIVE